MQASHITMSMRTYDDTFKTTNVNNETDPAELQAATGLQIKSKLLLKNTTEKMKKNQF